MNGQDSLEITVSFDQCVSSSPEESAGLSVRWTRFGPLIQAVFGSTSAELSIAEVATGLSMACQEAAPDRDANTIYPPDLPRWIVTLSPMPTHLDWELGELLKTLGIHEMDRVSADEIHLPIWSDKIALGLFALNGLPLNNLGGSKLQVTLHETQLMAFQKDLEEWRHNTEFMLNLPETEGIAKLYEVLEDKKGYYVIMEKVAGQDLFETMTGKGLLPVAEVKEVIKQLLQALAELHARNCIHKDLKLENVMFDRTPPINAKVDWSNTGDQSPVKVKLIDFDTVETVQPQTPKKAKDVLGTDQYIAQEAYDGNYSAASDIFAVGVIGYRLLTAKFPFRADIFDDEAGDNWVGSPKMKEIRQKLQNYKIDWNHRVFSLEPQACNLIKAMLASNERERPTAKEALANGWFNETGRRRSMPDLDRAGRVTECRTVSVCSI
ncbi:unnamed protein product [Durusdinium trenchii]|uniref:Protein kinase domain-containing protein n=1 Tax=Durusdinium trenchii TaxID=1381693 RepID=A0ABP0M2E5_9DINO